jgi:hypothetical protein
VKFGSTTVAGTNYTVNSFGTQINVTNVPSGTSAVDVTVITAAGTSSITAGSTYTYLPAPTITNLSPSAGDAVGNNTIIITGTAFTNASAVMFGSKPATSFTVNSSTQITAVSPSGTGTVGVQVTGPGGTSVASNFTYNAATSVISVTPNTGSTSGNTTVEITGTNFTGATAVKFGTQNATSFTVVNSTKITAVSPAGSAGIVGVTVVVGGTDYTLPSAFTYTAAVAVSAITTAAENPASQILPVESTVALIATSSTPESMVFCHFGRPLISIALSTIFELAKSVFEIVIIEDPERTRSSALGAVIALSNFFTAIFF